MRLFSFFLLVVFGSMDLKAQTLTIHISEIRNTSGSIRIQFFDTKEHFDDEKPLFTKTAEKTSIVEGVLHVTYTGIPPGTYGIAILDDENNNEKMDYGIFLPEEGFGFSDYFHTGMSRPDFNKFKFSYGKEGKEVFIRIRYL